MQVDSAALVEQLYIPPIRLGCGDSVLLAELPNLQPTLLTRLQQMLEMCLFWNFHKKFTFIC
jgi:hypothetical protein